MDQIFNLAANVSFQGAESGGKFQGPTQCSEFLHDLNFGVTQIAKTSSKFVQLGL